MAEKEESINDQQGLLTECKTQKDVDFAYDKWDKTYGESPHEYETYVLTDGTKTGKYKFGPLTFNAEPFYVGCGRIGRHKKSSMLSRQLDRYNFKIERMKKIHREGGVTKVQIVGHYFTKNQASLAEKKLMNLIPKDFLENSLRHLCEVPLKGEDYNCMRTVGILTT